MESELRKVIERMNVDRVNFLNDVDFMKDQLAERDRRIATLQAQVRLLALANRRLAGVEQ